jgi:predicted RNase H-like HicB family nuclease
MFKSNQDDMLFLVRHFEIKHQLKEHTMRNEFTAFIERDGDWYIACSQEIPGANGQGKTREECLQSLSAAIDLILKVRRVA